jgi:hypothetical protein
MIKTLLLGAAIFAGATVAGFGQNTTEVDWTNVLVGTATDTLFNNVDVALSAGTSNTNQTGDLIELGYFSAATPGSEFSGTFIPLTETTAIGDSANPSAGKDAAGDFGFNSYFVSGTTSYVYNPGSDSGEYMTHSAVSISSTTPANDQILAIRFFSTTSGTTGYYNTVTADAWQWQTPTAETPVVSINLVGSSLLWQDSATPFETGIAVVPEPATLSLVGGAFAIGAMVWRRRT